MRRYILNGLTVLSLLVCLATVVLWVRGHWYFDRIFREEQGHYWRLAMGDSQANFEAITNPYLRESPIELYSTRRFTPERPHPSVDTVDPHDHDVDREWNLPGLSYVSFHAEAGFDPPFTITNLAISYWLIVPLTLILPASRLCFRKRQLPGHCPNCHYDLRATPDRCPECGTIPAKGGL